MKNHKRSVNNGVRVLIGASVLGIAGLAQLPRHVTFSQGTGKALRQVATQMLRMNESLAFGGGLTDNLINTLRNGYGLLMGYSDRTSYVNLVCNGVDPGAGLSCDGPPQAGIVGTLSSIVNELPSIAQSAGITSCETVPSSGSFTGQDASGDTITLTFAPATHSVPQGWQSGGAPFAHRVEFSETLTTIGTPTQVDIAFEFTCGNSGSAYTAVSMPSGTAGFNRDIAVYNGPVSPSENGIQIFMAEHVPGTPTQIRGVDAIDIRYNPASSAFSLNGELMGNSSIGSENLDLLIKLAVNGNYQSGEALVFTRTITSINANGDPTGVLDPAVMTAAGATNAALESDPGNYDMSSDILQDATLQATTRGNPAVEVREACVNFAAGLSTAPSDPNCGAFALAAAPDPTPALDPSGSWSIAWAQGQLDTVLEDF